MFYALLKRENRYHFTYGTIKRIARDLADACDTVMAAKGSSSLRELEQRYTCQFADYEALLEAEKITPEMLTSFTFSVDGVAVSVEICAEGYEALMQAVAEYPALEPVLDPWTLDPTLEEMDEFMAGAINELNDLCDGVTDRECIFLAKRKVN